MKRIQANSVTEALVSAMERAEEIEHVIILVQYKPEVKIAAGGFFTNGDQTLETSNWLVDRFKAWILSHICSCDNCG